jgi:hypothetical protein
MLNLSHAPRFVSLLGHELAFHANGYYLPDMVRRIKIIERTEQRWRIVRITHTPAKLVGHVYAPDEETALKLAVAQFHIEKAWRNWLLALRET